MQDAVSSPEIGYWSSTLFSDSGRTVSWRYRLGYTWFLGTVDGARVRCVMSY
ncbi:MAG: hypothetical protein LBI65_01110 [Candidatus Symbiothrix sp.]|nr:hypothetical protein [Candidatus Symbiothrix sp.]